MKRIGDHGHHVIHHRKLPPSDSRTFRAQDYDLVAFGLPRSDDVRLPYIREMCTTATKTKLLLLGEPPKDLAFSELDPWGKLAYIPLSSVPDVLTNHILECLDNDWLVWGPPTSGADPRSCFEGLPQQLRPLLLAAGPLLRHLGSLSRGGSLDEALEDLLGVIVDVLGCEGSSFLAWDPQDRELTLRASVGARVASVRGVRHKLGSGVAGWVAEQDRPLLVWDLGRVARFAHRAKRKGSGRSFVCVPVSDEERLLGVLTANARKDDVFTSAVMTALSELAAELACGLRIAAQLQGGSREGKTDAHLATARAEPAAGTSQLSRQAGLPRPGELLRSLPLGIIAFDTDLEVTFCNDRAAEALSLEGEAIRGEALAEALDLEKGLWESTLTSVLTEGRSDLFFQVRRAGSPGQKWLHLVMCPRRNDSGEVDGVLMAVVDVSHNASLERRLALVERQALLGELASTVAHELNNALDGIMRFVSLALRQESEDGLAHEYLEDARSGLLRMANVVARLLSFSRKGAAVKHDADLGELVYEALRFFAERAKDQRVKFEVDVSDPIAEVRHTELFEVFTNLIKNALDVMPDGGQLSVRTRREADEAVITFTDTGPGMSEEVKKQLFEPFFTTKESGEGTGLGLSISHDIVRRCNGSIEVESELGKGTTFSVRLPLPGQAA